MEAGQGNWTGWCDGCALPNPGRMAVGGVLCGPDGSRREISRATGRTGCNNEAEILALQDLLEFALECGVRRLLVFSDSDLVVRVVPDPASREARRLAAHFAEVRKRVLCFEQFELRWLPQHRNREADELSRQAFGLPPRAPVLRKRA